MNRLAPVPTAGRACGRAATLLAAASILLLLGAPLSPAAQGLERRIFSIGDVHGALENFTAILQEVDLVDDDLHWSGGDSILVQTGDILDRGPHVRDSMDLLMRLQEEAPRFGGEVIVILGNHEAMNLVAMMRDTTPADTAAFVDEESEKRLDEAWERWREMRIELAEQLDQPRPRFDREAWEAEHPVGWVERLEALGPGGKYGRWLRRLPTAVRIDNMLFMHAGLNPAYGDLSPDEINERVSGELLQFDEARRAMVDAGLITPAADLVEMIRNADEKLVAMIQKMQETGERPDGAGQELARKLEWVVNYSDWQLLTREGLLWFRDLARWIEEEHADEVAELLEKQDIDHIIVGHTVQADGMIRARFDGGVILTDTGMLEPVYHGRPSALEVRDGTFTARYIGESEVVLAAKVMNAAAPRPAARALPIALRVPAVQLGEPRSDRGWLGPDGDPLPFHGDDELLDFLRTADVVAMEEVDNGKTAPRRVELVRDGVRARAIFHTVELYREQARINGRFHAVFRDDWRAQVAAYRMARLVGLNSVPPTVRRTIDNETGSLQLWLENDGLRTNAERVQAREYPSDVDAWLAQEWTMRVFDALIFNDDRHPENVLVDRDWKLWMIDHTRAFQSTPELRNPDDLNRISRELLAALRQLRRAQVEATLQDVLAPDQINALVTRRDLLLEHFGRLIDILGESAVVLGGAPRLERPAIGDRTAGATAAS